MELTLNEWKIIKHNSSIVTNIDCVCDLQHTAKSLYQENWYKYKDSYYSLLFNQVACVWVQKKDNRTVFAFKHYDIKQNNAVIEYFLTQKDLVCRYVQLLRLK